MTLKEPLLCHGLSGWVVKLCCCPRALILYRGALQWRWTICENVTTSKRCNTLYLVREIIQRIWKPLFGSGPLQLTSCRCISVICVCFSKGCACEIVMKRAECWNKEETPRMNPEGPSDNRPLSRVQNVNEGRVQAAFSAVEITSPPFRGRGPSLWGGWECGVSCVEHRAVGGRAGARGPDGCQGNICSTSWLGLISTVLPHTLDEKRAFFA